MFLNNISVFSGSLDSLDSFIKNGQEKIWRSSSNQYVKIVRDYLSTHGRVASAIVLIANSIFFLAIHKVADLLTDSNFYASKFTNKETSTIKRLVIDVGFIGPMVVCFNLLLSKAIPYPLSKNAMAAITTLSIFFRIFLSRKKATNLEDDHEINDHKIDVIAKVMEAEKHSKQAKEYLQEGEKAMNVGLEALKEIFNEYSELLKHSTKIEKGTEIEHKNLINKKLKWAEEKKLISSENMEKFKKMVDLSDQEAELAIQAADLAGAKEVNEKAAKTWESDIELEQFSLYKTKKTKEEEKKKLKIQLDASLKASSAKSQAEICSHQGASNLSGTIFQLNSLKAKINKCEMNLKMIEKKITNNDNLPSH